MKARSGWTILASAATLMLGGRAQAQNENTATGYHALYVVGAGDANTAMGYAALHGDKGGSNNSAFGRGALYKNVNSSDNTAVGYLALYSNVEGGLNTAVGSNALSSVSNVGYNTAVGTNALERFTSGIGNTAVGANALQGRNNPPYVTGSMNTAIGTQALRECDRGSGNIAIGYEAAPMTNEGGFNILIGYRAGPNNVSGHDNIAIGYQAGTGPTDGYNNIALGTDSNVAGFNQVRIGNSSHTVIGGYVPWTNLSDARFKKNVTEDVPGLEFITKLRPVTFYWDMEKLRAFEKTNARIEDGSKGKQKFTGFLAQEVEAAAQKARFDFSGVIKPADEKTATYQLSYADFVVPLVKSVQEQQKEIDSLKATLAAMAGQPGGPPWHELFLGLVAGLAGAGLAFAYGRRQARIPTAHAATTVFAHD